VKANAIANAILGGIGFTATGIAESSLAAGMMSTAAIANGGGVAAGSLVSILQSMSVAGATLGLAPAVGMGLAAGGVVYGASTLLRLFIATLQI
jgi:hypothetical protein